MSVWMVIWSSRASGTRATDSVLELVVSELVWAVVDESVEVLVSVFELESLEVSDGELSSSSLSMSSEGT